MKLRVAGLAVLSVMCAVQAPITADDYSYMWWSKGWRGRSPEGGKVLHFQSNRYGAAVDVEKVLLTHLGKIESPQTYANALVQPGCVVASLSPAKLILSVATDGTTFTCSGAARAKEDLEYPVRLIESGRFVQRCDIQGLLFFSERGTILDARGRLEIVVWPDRLSLILEIEAVGALPEMSLGIRLTGAGATIENRSTAVDLPAGARSSVSLVWLPEAGDSPRFSAGDVAATDRRNQDAPLPVSYDAGRGWFYVDLPERNWDIATEPDRLDRFGLQLRNDTDSPKTFPLLFAFDGPFSGITGMCPILRDADGGPSGIPVQISKNWHRREERRLHYEGPWFHGFTQITVAPGEAWAGELAIAYARWGGVPAASHAQLCLIGWGTNQRWDQAAIGSWGESICYDPDINLNRSMIDDVRPLMVTGMRGGQWEWTCNVGGGDFLVYEDPQGRRQFLTGVKAAYLASGPNLTETHYAGITSDGRISAEISVSTPRCDDVNRAYHRMRYDILSPTPFSRLAFYQVGADRYNDHQFSTLARGNVDGQIEEWPAEHGGERYLRTGIPCEGDAAWFSLHGGIRNGSHETGAWANRGLVVRSWKARLGGQDIPYPSAAVYGTENGIPSANIEIVPPPGVTQLESGDYIAAEFELLIVPAGTEDYYGPNQALRAHLAEHANTWAPVHRLAQGNHLDVQVKRGQLLHQYPVTVCVDPRSRIAEFEIRGGVGYVPITIAGLPGPNSGVLECDGVPIDQSVHGGDFWQADRDAAAGSYSITYNVCLDSPPDTVATRRFRFHPCMRGEQIQGASLLNGISRVLFLGDSITYDGRYVADFEAWLLTRFPERSFEVINAGLPSETVSGLSEEGHANGEFPRPDLKERLDRVLAAAQPELVIACYGMNCGICQSFDETRFARYRQGIEYLREMVDKAGTRLVLVTPPVYDHAHGKGAAPDYNEGVLGAYSRWLLSRRADGWLVADLHGPMNAALQRRRLTDTEFTFQPDGVHPDDEGHWFIARQLIAYFGDVDAASAQTPVVMLGDRPNSEELLGAVHARMALLRDAWLTHTGHQRPGLPHGLPLQEANTQASQLNERIAALKQRN